MTKEEKDLLLRDLCARLLYGIKCTTKASGWKAVYSMRGCLDKKIFLDCPEEVEGDDEWLVQNIVPYLRPMSSMTEEEKRYIHNKFGATSHGSIETYSFESFEGGHSEVYMVDMAEFIDWLNRNMFDYRGLISKGLAIEVTEENNPYKE